MTEIVTKTPYKQLDKIGRPDIFIKLECDQFANSFKARGIVNFLQHTADINGLVTFTTGNHGIAVAAIANKLGLKAIIVSSQKLSVYKKTIIESYNATIQLIDFYNLDQATDFAKELALKMNFTFVPLFGNDNLLTGYSEIANEICEDISGNLKIFFPVGSGSLLFANAKKAKEINSKNEIIGVEPKVFQRLNGAENHNNPSSSIADSLSIDRIPNCNLELKKYTDSLLAIEETEIIAAMKIIYDQFEIVTEAGGAITLAAALKTDRDETKKVAVITGKNISSDKFHFLTCQP